MQICCVISLIGRCIKCCVEVRLYSMWFVIPCRGVNLFCFCYGCFRGAGFFVMAAQMPYLLVISERAPESGRIYLVSYRKEHRTKSSSMVA